MTLDAGTSTDGLPQLQYGVDGDNYHVTEAAATPGIDLTVEFVSVQQFSYVHILGYYEGGGNHAVSIQLYNWAEVEWHTWDAMDGIESATTNHSFYVPCGTNYIGTGGDAGTVRVRFNHTMAGNASHDLYLDVVALYDLDYKLDHHWGPWR